MNIKEASKYSIYHSKEIKKSSVAGCYYCLQVFDTATITNWTDNNDTALCPHCGIDSVLPETAPYDLNLETLSKLNEYWFTALEEE